MLGQFLEVSIGVESPAESLELFRSLGFQELVTLEVMEPPYAVVWDGRIAIGLHASREDGDAPVLTFVRPELQTYLRAFRRAGVEPAFARLGADEFHRAAFEAPDGQRLVLYEARTFSEAARLPETVPACGDLLEFSLPAASLEAALAFWERLGLEPVAGGEQPHRWSRLAGSGLVLGLHEAAHFAPGLTFRAGNFEARCEYLRALGRKLRPRAPVAVDARRAATLVLPCPLAIYLLDAAQ